jgi:orotate phosphoribosyltransferase
MNDTSFNQAVFNDFVIKNKVIGIFNEPITLKSGRQSYWYVNWRTVAENVRLIDHLSDYVLWFVDALRSSGKLKDCPNCFYGVPEGATKIGLFSQFKYALRFSNCEREDTQILPMGRGKSKEHGSVSDRFFLGQPKGRVIVIEDVTTTGGSLIEEIERLRLLDGVQIIAAIGLTNRMESNVEQRINEKFSIPYYAMSNALDLLPIVLEGIESDKVLNSITKDIKELR